MRRMIPILLVSNFARALLFLVHIIGLAIQDICLGARVNSNFLKLNSIAVPDRNTEEWARWRVRQAYQKIVECPTPEKYTLPSYVNVDTSPKESSQEPSEPHEKVKKEKIKI